jgi:hypothetical protein
MCPDRKHFEDLSSESVNTAQNESLLKQVGITYSYFVGHSFQFGLDMESFLRTCFNC